MPRHPDRARSEAIEAGKPPPSCSMPSPDNNTTCILAYDHVGLHVDLRASTWWSSTWFDHDTPDTIGVAEARAFVERATSSGVDTINR